jgi:hypothetical protein
MTAFILPLTFSGDQVKVQAYTTASCNMCLVARHTRYDDRSLLFLFLPAAAFRPRPRWLHPRDSTLLRRPSIIGYVLSSVFFSMEPIMLAVIARKVEQPNQRDDRIWLYL